VIAGIAFLAIAVLGNITGRIEPGPQGRIGAAIAGGGLLLLGLFLQWPLLSAGSSQMTLEEGVDRPGGDYGRVVEADAESCKKACQSDAICVAFTFVPAQASTGKFQGYPESMCFLKNTRAAPVATPDLTSGIRR
jgi:hypothetical protein